MGVYFIADEAAANLSEIWDGHIERGGQIENANGLIAEFLEVFQNLADFPDIGTPRTYLQADQRAFPHDDYIIVYRRQPERVDILHVVYGRMDLDAYFSEV